MNKLSVIIPYCSEYPQIYFTLCNLRCELETADFDWEIITVSNQGTDKGFERISAVSREHPNLIALEYNDKLSHWNAKNQGIQRATNGVADPRNVLFFIDSHCILSKNALVNMFNYYTSHYDELHGTLHMPILYMNELQGRELQYRMICNISDDKMEMDKNPKNTPHNLHYVFTRCPHTANPHHRVSCMSMCGAMMRREMYDLLGGWPTEFGIYGGGENFINFTLGVMDYSINVFNPKLGAVHHYAEKRSYQWNYNDWVRNRMIAAYMQGGKEWARVYALNIKGNKSVLEDIFKSVVENDSLIAHRELLKPNIKMTPQEFVRREFESGRFVGEYE